MRIRNRFVLRNAARLVVWGIRLLFATCRTTIISDQRVNCYRDTGDRRYLYCIWHDQIIMTLFSDRPQKVAGLVSKHQDGTWVSDVMEFLKIRPVRGSASKGGARALRELIDTARDLHICITPDGPRGPRHEAKTGIVFLASRAGRGVVPVAYSCARCWTIRGNWTDMMIPKPFTKLYAVAGNPIDPPADADRETIAEYTSRLEAEMNRLELLADRAARGEKITLEMAAGNVETTPSSERRAA